MSIPNFNDFIKVDLKYFELVLEKLESLPFQGNENWKCMLKEKEMEYGPGHLWRGALYWSAELGQFGSITLFVSDSEIFIERLYIDDFYRGKGLSYYLLREVRKRWPSHRITFQDDSFSREIWKSVSKNRVIKELETSDEESVYYQVVGIISDENE